MKNKVLVLDNDKKVMILNQCIYNNKSYLLASELDKEDNLTKKFLIFQEGQENNEIFLSLVEDKKILSEVIQILKKDL